MPEARRLGEIRRSDDAGTAQGSEMYRAIQLGGFAVVASDGRGTWRIGAAVTLGHADQTPELRDAAADLRTDTRTWLLQGTWMDTTGAYVDLQAGYGAITGRKRATVEDEDSGVLSVEVARPRGSRWPGSRLMWSHSATAKGCSWPPAGNRPGWAGWGCACSEVGPPVWPCATGRTLGPLL